MKTFSSVPMLAALGVLSAVAGNARAVDTSAWTCESCPFEKAGTSGAIELGIGAVSEASARFGDFTGLDRKGAFLIAGGSARLRGEGGLHGSIGATDLGLDTRAVAAELTQEGLYALRLGYAEMPHHWSDQDPGDRGFKRTRLDAGATWNSTDTWTTALELRHEVRDGFQRSAGSFFSSATQLLAPVDQVTDQLEVSASYAGRSLQASLAYRFSHFRNGHDSLTWANPFAALPGPSETGQLALAPGNQFHQVEATIGYQISPTIRASGQVAFGTMTQDAAYLAATLNPNLIVPALPAPSLQGHADTLDASVKLSADVTERLRIDASLSRNERDNKTPVTIYPTVAADAFVGTPRANPAYSFTQDRLKLSADYRAPWSVKLAAGAEYERRQRPQQEAPGTRETTLWARISAQPLRDASVALKLAHAERTVSEYRALASIDPPENPLLRRFNMADRKRDTAGLRADLTLHENIAVGIHVDLANDDYPHSEVGLTDVRSVAAGVDVSAAIDDATQLHLFVQGERIRSRQAGSQLFGQPDWTGRTRDRVEMVGLGVRHAPAGGKVELGADLTVSRLRSAVTVDAGVAGPLFPPATTSVDSVKVYASWRLTSTLSLTGSYAYEHDAAQDWRLAGVLPATVPNLLTLGEQPAHYHVNVLRVACRYRF